MKKIKSKKQIGNFGEKISKIYLEEIGFKIIETNYYSKYGEIDIIAKEKEEYIFIEVKTRQNNSYGKPLEAVNNLKRRHMYTTAKIYLYKNYIKGVYIRFDVIEVYITKNQCILNHIKGIEI